MPPSRSPFEYAVVRVVPDIQRAEFVNAGLILFSRPRSFLAARARLDEDALAALRPGCDADGIREQLAFIEEVAGGLVETGPFAGMTQSERFHWLTTPRSTVVQPGPLHAGTTEDPAATFEHLYQVMVSR
ncbi:MAG TPA: DUF3037 domain-containing protein [Candidatus Limnocylindria bacterium]|nr:DUF3037 domain-containing protein [Candidatus Limnocylindria bacterium]